MRSKEFINEASVFKTANNQYVPGYRMAISTKGGGVSVNAIKSVIPNFSPDEELSIVTPDTPSTYQIPLAKKIEAIFKLKRPTGEVIELQGTKSSIESSLNAIGPSLSSMTPGTVKLPNKGDTAEGLLGASMFAKMIKREAGGIGKISTDDVWAVFDKMKPVSSDDYLVTSKDMGGATDKIWFRLKVKGFVKTALNNPDLRKKLNNWVLSPVNYVNSKEGDEYAEQFYKNGQADEIGIISDGLSAQSERKSDVYTVVRDPVTGNIAKELLPISLKAGAEQFAQHSGSKFSSISDMFSRLGIDISKVEGRYNNFQSKGDQLGAASVAYRYVENVINKRIRSDSEEAEFVEKFANALRFWATSDNDNVRVVSFGTKGAFEVLRFDQLVPAMKALNLEAEYISGDNPRLIVKDSKKGTLFQLRTYLQTTEKGKYQRNVIEKGPLLSIIASSIERSSPLEAVKKNHIGSNI